MLLVSVLFSINKWPAYTFAILGSVVTLVFCFIFQKAMADSRKSNCSPRGHYCFQVLESLESFLRNSIPFHVHCIFSLVGMVRY